MQFDRTRWWILGAGFGLGLASGLALGLLVTGGVGDAGDTGAGDTDAGNAAGVTTATDRELRTAAVEARRHGAGAQLSGEAEPVDAPEAAEPAASARVANGTREARVRSAGNGGDVPGALESASSPPLTASGRSGAGSDSVASEADVVAWLSGANARDVARGLRALQEMEDPDRAAEIAAGVLFDPDSGNELRLMEQLGDLSPSLAADLLPGFLDDSNPALRSAAARKLGELGFSSSVAPLQEAFESGSETERPGLARSLCDLGECGPQRELSEGVAEGLRSSDAGERGRALALAQALGRSDLLHDAFDDPDSGVREPAIRRATSLCVVADLPLFEAATHDPVPSVAQAARDAIRYCTLRHARP